MWLLDFEISTSASTMSSVEKIIWLEVQAARWC